MAFVLFLRQGPVEFEPGQHSYQYDQSADHGHLICCYQIAFIQIIRELK